MFSIFSLEGFKTSQMNVKISVIIPVFNASKYVKDTFNSLQNQTFKDFEVIFINDRSTDNSLEILKDFEIKDSRVCVLSNKINKGAGYSRNRGISLAKGDYIYFLDSDDLILEKTLEILYNESTKYSLDILEGRFYKIADGQKKINPKNFKLQEDIVTGQYYFNNLPHISIVVWDKLWKTEFIKSTGIVFDEHRYEDVTFVISMFIKAKRVKNIDFAFYNYIERENSIVTSKITDKHIKESLVLVEDLESRYLSTKQEEINPIIEKIFFTGFASILSKTIFKSNNATLRKNAIKIMVKTFSKYRWDVLKAKKVGLKEKALLFISPVFAAKMYGIFKSK